MRDILDADTAAVLLLDEASGELVARAARGIEEEVREGVRVPLGAGFAGRIAATKGPIQLTRVDSTTVANPILWEKGIKVMLGVPLLSGQRLLGVLHVGRLDDRPFSDEDLGPLRVVADRVAERDVDPPAGDRTGGRRPARTEPDARARCPASLASSWRRVMWPPKDARSVATGTTSSRCPPARSGSWSATSRVMD